MTGKLQVKNNNGHTAGTAVGNGVTYALQGNKLVIEVDLTKDFGPSSSGKTIQVASTCGNVPIAGPDGVVYLGLNVFKK